MRREIEQKTQGMLKIKSSPPLVNLRSENPSKLAKML